MRTFTIPSDGQPSWKIGDLIFEFTEDTLVRQNSYGLEIRLRGIPTNYEMMKHLHFIKSHCSKKR